VLQQARGNVRCGGCSHAFNALEYLSEEMPGAAAPEEAEVPVDELAETSRRLLQTLDELAGPEEVRIEDTGVEWRVLEEIESGIDVDQSDSADEPRYDDNSPLPDEFHDDDDEAVPLADEFDQDDEHASAASQPHRRLTDTQFNAEFNEVQGDLALTEPEEWTDLLDEVRESEPHSLEVEEELAAIHNQLSAGRNDADADADADADKIGLADIDTQFNLQAEALGLDVIGSDDALTDEVPLLPDNVAPAHESIHDEESPRKAELAASADAMSADSNEHLSDDALMQPEAGASDEPLFDEAAPVEFDDESETSINEALPDELGEGSETSFNEAFPVELDEESDTSFTEANEDIRTAAGEQAHEASADDTDVEAGDTDGADELDGDAKHQNDDQPGALVDEIDDESSEQSDDAPEADGPADREEAAADDDQGELSAGAIRESTGEFEAQIEVAASALGGLDDEDQLDFDAEGISSALEEAETEPAADIDEDTDVDKDLPATAADDPAETAHVVPQQTEEELTVNMEIDQELMALATQDDDLSATLVGVKGPNFPFDENSGEVEKIIMEGEEVRSDVEQGRRVAENAARSQLDDPIDLADTYAASRDKLWGGRRRYDPPGYATVAAVVFLIVALGAQLIHNSRETLATTGFFNQTIAPVYRMLGNPITPAWNIKGWQFEVTNGSIDEAESALVIVSRLVNRDSDPLPYPLVHVSLTNRWEDVMGSRILEPDEYLAGALDPTQPVQPGENFTAVITIENPSEEATGFKLNVCYRDGPETVRCAIEDFKN